MSYRHDDDWSDRMAMGTLHIIGTLIALVFSLVLWIFRRQRYYSADISNRTSRSYRTQSEDNGWWPILLPIVPLVLFLFAVAYVNWNNARADRHRAQNTQDASYAYYATQQADAHQNRALIFAVVGFVAAGGGTLGFIKMRPRSTIKEVAAKTEQAIIPGLVIYTIKMPRDVQWSHEQALKFLEQFVYTLPELYFSIHADADAIRWQIVTRQYGLDAQVVEHMVRTIYPRAEVDIQIPEASDKFSGSFYRYTSFYDQPNMFVAPMLYVNKFKEADPLAALTQAMNGLRPGERIEYAVFVSGVAIDAYDVGERLITRSTIHPLQYLSRAGIGDALQQQIGGQARQRKYEWWDQTVFEDKLRQRLYNASVIVQVDAVDAQRVSELMVLVDTHFSHFTYMPYNGLCWVERPIEQHTIHVETSAQAQNSSILNLFEDLLNGQINRQEQPPILVLEPRELATLWHLPHDDFSAGRVLRGRGLVEIPEAVARIDEDSILVGMGRYNGTLHPVRLSESDRVTHMNIIGKTGTGKSTLLHAMIHQDIDSGKGVAVIDPHGQLIRDILRHSIPEDRVEDVVLLDFAQQEYPIPLNPLRSIATHTGTLKVVSVIERLFEGTDQRVRIPIYLRAALKLLQTDPEATMRDMARIFVDDVYREQLLAQIDDPDTLDFWDYQFNRATPGWQRQVTEPILNRIRPFYANPYLYPSLCHPQVLDFHSFIAEKKIILVSLAMDHEQVPEQERYLVGALLVTYLQIAGMKAHGQEPFYIYIDEAQKLVTSSLDVLFTEARKYGLALITANQFLDQLEGKTLDAVMGTVGSMVAFGCSVNDGRDLAPYMKPDIDAQDMVNLNRFQAAVKMQVEQATQPAFTVLPLSPREIMNLPVENKRNMELSSEQWEDLVVDCSRTAYLPYTREEVETWLQARYPRRKLDRLPANDDVFYEPDDEHE